MKLYLYRYQIALFTGMWLWCFAAKAQTARTEINLANNNWSIWLDTAAKWQDDKLYTPPVNIKELPVNLPTGGWSSLNKSPIKNAHLPATVEEYFWGVNGSQFGSTGNYLGVSWFSTKMLAPAGNPANVVGQQLLLNLLKN